MQFEIRKIAPTDDGSIAAVIRDCLREFGADRPGFAWQDPELDRMCASYRATGYCYYVVAPGESSDGAGEVLGGGGIAPLAGGEPDTCELQKMYFAQAARGLGLGSRMLERLLAEARSMGYRRCYLETLARMTAAQKLYRRFGFEPLEAPLGDTGHGGCDNWYALQL